MTTGNAEAYIFITAPVNGGSDITVDAITAVLSQNKISYGIDKEAITKAVTDKMYQQQIRVAMATLPINGKNGVITYRYSQYRERVPVADENGVVDYKNLQYIREIHKGDVIADITPPTNGKNGTDVRSMTMYSLNGKNAAFLLGKNTELTEDGLQIIASVDGNLTYHNNAFHIEPVVTIPGDVDSSIGNLEFCGDIIVKGNVLEGFKVSSNKTITVIGTVNGAKLEAVGDIIIKRGCINAGLICHGNVSAMFFERCQIKADSDISAQSYVMCDVYCGGSLKTVLTRTTGCGIVGGKYVSLTNIETYSIGSKSYAPTEITLGDNALLSDEKKKLIEQVTGWEKSLSDLSLVVNFLNEKKKDLHHLPDDKEEILGNSARQKIIITKQISTANKRITEIDSSLKVKQRLSVSCKGTVYPGTTITVNDLSYKVERESVRCCIAPNAENSAIIVTPL